MTAFGQPSAWLKLSELEATKSWSIYPTSGSGPGGFGLPTWVKYNPVTRVPPISTSIPPQFVEQDPAESRAAEPPSCYLTCPIFRLRPTAT